MPDPSPLNPPAAVATTTLAARAATSPWENLDRALSRLESAILTQKHNARENGTLETERLQRQNTHLVATLRQTLVDLKTILNG